MEDPRRLRLPDDVLAGVLARLAPRGLAVSRCVCREWRAVADDRCRHLLRPDLPLTVGGIFVGSYCTAVPDFFARPSTARSRSRSVAGRLDRMDDCGFGAYCVEIADCCNGLLLLEDEDAGGGHELAVANPATRRSVRLPRCSGFPDGHDHDEDEGVGLHYWSYLAFDPTVSPHYEVISMQDRPGFFIGPVGNKRLEELQWPDWPPPVYAMRVYSSRTGRWEKRHFALDDEGLPRKSVTDGVTVYGHAAYWRGALYVHCDSHFILRINMSADMYQVIDLPADGGYNSYESYLGKSKNGIYFAAIINHTCRVLVWFLDESDGKVQWVFKHGINRYNLITHFWDNPAAQTDRPWILQDSDSHKELQLLVPGVEVEKNLGNLDWESDDDESAVVDIKDYCNTTVEEEKNVDWDTEDYWEPDDDDCAVVDEDAVDIKDYCDTENTYVFRIFGFHPYKEIVFLYSSRVVAYHFSRSKVQDLGELRLKYPDPIGLAAFIYTPCWVGDLSENS